MVRQLATFLGISYRGLKFFVSLAGGAAFALGLSYILGHSILDGSIAGSDSPLHIGYAIWIDQYFPQLPHWYPKQGAGISLLHGYSILPHILVVILHRLTGLSIYQAFRLLSFLSFPLSAFVTYVFCWSELKSRTAGIIAMALLLLAPVTWTWLYNWGFFPQQIAVALLPASLLFFNRVLRSASTPSGRSSRQLWAAAYISCLSIAVLSHMMVAASIGIGSLLIGTFKAVGAGGGRSRKLLYRCLRHLTLFAAMVALIMAAYLVPFLLYGQQANRGGLSTPAPSDVHRLFIPEFFGLRSIDPQEILTRMQFPLVTIVFAGLGVFLAVILIKSGFAEAREATSLGFAALAGTLFTLTPSLPAMLLRISGLLYYLINFRTVLILVTFLLPILAGFGAHAALKALLGMARLRAARQNRPSPKAALEAVLQILTTPMAFLMVALAIRPLASPASPDMGDLPLGPTGLDVSNLWTPGGEASGTFLEQIAPWSWPPLALGEGDESIYESRRLASVLPSGEHQRIDISPYVGDRAKDLVGYGDASQINTYTFQINLFKDMWSYEQSVFFSREAPANEYGTAQSLQGLADWFGIHHVILDAEQDPTSHYLEAGWSPTRVEGSTEIWSNPAPVRLASATDKPAVLIVGKAETDSYMSIFRLANEGMLPFSQALLVQGRERIDEYEPDELKRFAAVILYGHDYRDSSKAWQTLKSYVVGGGSIFVDTGWEFWIPEWEFENAPEVLPVARITWTDYGKAEQYELGPKELVGEVDTSLFKPLVWEGFPWTLSGAEPSDVRDWGKVALATSGRPLVVTGQLGEGRVVWSGMNLIAHATYQGWNHEEIGLLGNLLGWLLRDGGNNLTSTTSIRRDHPDRVDFVTSNPPPNGYWLYWREAYYPNWHAYVTDSGGAREIPIYRGGPGFMLMPVETDDPQATVTLRWELPLVEQAAIVASALGVLLLAALVVDGLFLGGNGFTWLKIGLVMRIPRPFLGEGSNREWAEQKRAELEAGRLRTDTPPHLEPRQAISWWKGEQSGDGRPAAPAADERPAEAVVALAIEPPSDDLERALLESWLNGSGHDDDAWAEKLLGRKKPVAED